MRVRALLAAALAVALAVTLAGCGTFSRSSQELSKRAIAPKPNSAPPSHPLVTAFEPSWDDGPGSHGQQGLDQHGRDLGHRHRGRRSVGHAADAPRFCAR